MFERMRGRPQRTIMCTILATQQSCNFLQPADIPPEWAFSPNSQAHSSWYRPCNSFLRNASDRNGGHQHALLSS